MPVIAGYSPNLQLIIFQQNPNDVWGAGTNTNIATLLEQAISGYATVTFTSADITLTMDAGASATARNMYLVLDGTPASPYNLILPPNTKLYFVRNLTGQTITVKLASSIGVAVANNESACLYCDGGEIVPAITFPSIPTSDDPSGSVGLTAVNGFASTYMRSDAAPALDVGIAPTWTGIHQFTNATAPTVNDTNGTQYTVGFKEVPVNSGVADGYYIELWDCGKVIVPAAAGYTLFLSPTTTYPLGSVITIAGVSGGVTYINPSTATLTLAGTATTGTRTLAANGLATLIQISTGNWLISGAGVA